MGVFSMAVPFPQSVVDAAWVRSGGRCECKRKSHNHPYHRYATILNAYSRGKETQMGWEAHHIDSNGSATVDNCEILCQECHKNTRSYGQS